MVKKMLLYFCKRPIFLRLLTLPPHLYAQDLRQNNSWYVFNESETVYVFVHGIFSDSSGCWESDNGKYWPELLTKDDRFQQPSIFLGGYYTDFSSGLYRISDASNELLSNIRVPDSQGRPPVLSKKRIVFVAHSTGGLVVRYLLERNYNLFKDKIIGLVLLASPSRGSAWSNRLRWIREFYKNRMAGQLARDNDFVIDLDSRFADFIREKRLPFLDGIDAFENKFIVPGFFWNSEYVVAAQDSASYFGSYRIIPNTDHFSIAKPNGLQHPSHRLLWEFVDTRLKQISLAWSNSQDNSDGKAEHPVVAVKTRDTDWGGQCLVFAFEKLPKNFSLGTIQLQVKSTSALGQLGGNQAAEILSRPINDELPATIFATRKPINLEVRVQAQHDNDSFYIDYCPTLDRPGLEGKLTVTPIFFSPTGSQIEDIQVLFPKPELHSVTFSVSRPRNLVLNVVPVNSNRSAP